MECAHASAIGMVAAVRSEALEAWRVSTAVNNPNFDDVRVLERVGV